MVVDQSFITSRTSSFTVELTPELADQTQLRAHFE